MASGYSDLSRLALEADLDVGELRAPPGANEQPRAARIRARRGVSTAGYIRGCDHTVMNGTAARFTGVELYFEDLDRAREFYQAILGLQIADEERGRYTKLDCGPAFVCLERKGLETYPSRDKAVLFFEIADLEAAVASTGPQRFIHRAAGWAVLHDPEGHNILLIER